MSKVTVILVALACFGYGSAGVFGSSKVECGSSTSSKAFSLDNPSTPPRTCTYNVKAHSSYVCQLRIDFKIEMAQPTLPTVQNKLQYPQCIDDYLEVGGYKFCGSETNQHIYIPFNRTAGEKSAPIKIVSAVRSGGSQLPKLSWNLNVKQLECPKGSPVRSLPMEERSSFSDGFLIAPTGCLQYFPNNRGTVQSFNYNNGQGTYQGNLNYAICFRREAETEGIEWVFDILYFSNIAASSFSRCFMWSTDKQWLYWFLLLPTIAYIFRFDFKSFQLGYTAGVEEEIGDSCRPETKHSGLNEDRLAISDGEVEKDNINANLFCGSSLAGKKVTSRTPGPLVVVFHSDKIYKSNIQERGFSFDYSIL